MDFLRAKSWAEERHPRRQSADPSTAANLADIRAPSECRDMIRTAVLLGINTSGGKDSQAMTILSFRIVPGDRLIAVPAPVGEVERPETVRSIEATLPEGPSPLRRRAGEIPGHAVGRMHHPRDAGAHVASICYR